MTDFRALLRCLSEAGVEYILVGGGRLPRPMALPG